MGKAGTIPKKEYKKRQVRSSNVTRAAQRMVAKCKLCEDKQTRFIVAELHSQGYSPSTIRARLRDEHGVGTSECLIKKHLNEHEKNPLVWTGYIKSQFPTEESRKRYEASFLSKMSLVTELWSKYQVLSELFGIIAGEPGKANAAAATTIGIDKTQKLANEMRGYLTQMLQMQRERDIVVEVSKTVLYMLAHNFVDKLSVYISDLPTERRENIGKLLVEEVRGAIVYAKTFGREKLENMMQKVQTEYEKLSQKIE